jgi:hypothetical protein
MDFQIDFGKFNVGPRADGPLFAAASGIVLPLGPEECIYRLRADGSQHVMTHQVFEALHLCRAFRSLDEHVAVVAQGVQGLAGRTDVVRQVLDSLVARQLMLSGDSYLAALAQDAAANPAPLRAVFIRANDRPAGLRALAADLLANESAHRAGHRYVVLDESRDAASVRSNADTIASFAREAGVRVDHFDAGRWRATLDRLARARPEAADSLRWLCSRELDASTRSGDGAARNLATLLGAGARIALIDDQTRLPLRSAPDALGGLDLAAGSAMPVRFYDDVQAALAAGGEMPGDPFNAQLAWCGQSLGHVLARHPNLIPDRAALAGVEPASLPHLDAGSHIASTINGVRGDAAGSGRDWLFLLEGESRVQFWSDRERYLRQLDGASVWFGPRRPRVLDQAQHAPFLLDASRMQPPTLPDAARGDLLAGMLTRAMWPRSVALHSACTLGHQGQPGARRAGAAWQADTPGLASLLTDLLSSRLDDVRAESPARRLRSVANTIGDLAAASSAKRADMLAEYLAFARSDLVARLQASFLAAEDPPVYWQADVRELITINGRALTDAGAPRLDGWPESLDTPQLCADRFAGELDRFAIALDAWPAVWQHALEQGPRLLDA